MGRDEHSEFVISFDEFEKRSLTQIRRTPRKIRSTRLGAIEFTVESGIDGGGERVVPDEFRQLAPKGKSFSFDTIWDVTRMHFLDYKQRKEIQESLPFSISTGSISNLYKEGMAYFRACHEAAIPELKKRYRQKDRLFILQMDGTNEGGKWTHFQVRDSASNNVLLARRIPTENQADIETILRDVESWFGRPDGVISDMSGRGIAAVEAVWDGNVPLFICQFHFLRDIGKDLLAVQHEGLRKSFASARITAELNALRKSFVKAMENDDPDYLHGISIIDWILDYKSELHGEGMPFDLSWKHYYERCRQADKKIKEIFDTADRNYTKKATEIISRIRKKLSKILDNKAATRRYNALTASSMTFTDIRHIFHLDKLDKAAPLSRNATTDSEMQTQPAELRQQIVDMAAKLRQKATTLTKVDETRYLKAAVQLEKYKDQLANHIEFNGTLHPLPRTNNLCEISFRELKRRIRRTNGRKNLASVFDKTPAEIMLLQNLQDEEYCKILFKDRPIYEAFAEIPCSTVKGILNDMNLGNAKKVIDPIIKDPDFLILCKEYFLKDVS